jgi:methylglutamate dehydrogenase subunit A
MDLRSARYVVIGAGVHGLSTAWHLAEGLRASGAEPDVVVLDKTGVGAGASGIACGVIRNNYFQPAMRRLMAHSVSIWDSDPSTFSYHPVGYLQAGPESMRADVRQIFEQQREIGYSSTFVEGETESREYLTELFPDWQGDGITCVLHEHRGGYANNQASLRALAKKTESAGAQIMPGVRVTGIDVDARTVNTDQGPIQCEQLVVAAGPWTRDLWEMLGLPETVTVPGADGKRHQTPMWTYWRLHEGEVYHDGPYHTADGRNPPVLHVELMNTPVVDPATGEELDDNVYVYWKDGSERMDRPGIQGGGMPVRLGPEAQVEPYGHANDLYQAGEICQVSVHAEHAFGDNEDGASLVRAEGLGQVFGIVVSEPKPLGG